MQATSGSTFGGGHGLLLTESARTIGMGRFSAGLQVLAMTRDQRVYWSDEHIRDNPTVYAVPIVFGLTDEVELSAAFHGFSDIRPYVDNRNLFRGKTSPESGAGSVRAGIKVRLPFDRSSRLQIAGRVGAVMGTSKVQDDGLNYPWTRNGADIEGSLFETIDVSPHVRLFLEQGFVMNESKYFDEQFIGSVGLLVTPVPGLGLGLELRNRVFEWVGPQSVLAAGADPALYYNGPRGVGDPSMLKERDLNFNEDHLVIAPSVSWNVRESVTLHLGAVVNLADHQEPKESAQIHFGISLNGALAFMSDADNDGVRDDRDLEPATPEGFPVDAGGVSLDSDGDGVPDGRDREMNTPRGARVDAWGTGTDGDGDGVYDGIDREPDTPEGCRVDRYGVALDGDGDGVPDCLDREPDTPEGCPVDEHGVALDSDGDGVPDCLDREPDTPEGCAVDEHGVALDSDGDGVPDCNDLEPGTEQGARVDAWGRAIREEEQTLLDEGVIRVHRIHFGRGSAEIRHDSYATLRQVAEIVRKYPSLEIRVEGHTDNTGSRELNMRLSKSRAQAVLDYILAFAPELDRDRFSVEGYGPDRPIAPNKYEYGRMQNRRVEFVVTNKDELKNLQR